MIAFHSGDVLGNGKNIDGWADCDGPNYILSVKVCGEQCVSKALITSVGIPCQLSIIIALNSQVDIVAIPELFASAYIPWHLNSGRRLAETAQAFLNAGVMREFACCAAIAVNIIYDVIDRGFFDYTGTAKDCIFTSSGRVELNDECRENILSNEHVLSDLPFPCSTNRTNNEAELPF